MLTWIYFERIEQLGDLDIHLGFSIWFTYLPLWHIVDSSYEIFQLFNLITLSECSYHSCI